MAALMSFFTLPIQVRKLSWACSKGELHSTQPSYHDEGVFPNGPISVAKALLQAQDADSKC